MRDQPVITSNVARFLSALDSLSAQARSGRSGEAMGLLWGEPGEGKTTAVALAANLHAGIYLRARVTWSVTTMLGALMEELGFAPLARRNAMLDAAARSLAQRPRPVFVDEADYLFRQTEMLDALRDLYDVARVPIVLIGMGDMPRRVRADRKFARFERRITEWVEFSGLTLDDARKVASDLCEVEVADDLVAHLFERVGGSVGRFVNELSAAERVARTNGLSRLARADYARTGAPGGRAA
ncbi:MAG: ATP-binding protein [Bacteroidetes bacterium]|nr:ATP-binding protein [Bacteroidota bacterium]